MGKLFGQRREAACLFSRCGRVGFQVGPSGQQETTRVGRAACVWLEFPPFPQGACSYHLHRRIDRAGDKQTSSPSFIRSRRDFNSAKEGTSLRYNTSLGITETRAVELRPGDFLLALREFFILQKRACDPNSMWKKNIEKVVDPSSKLLEF